MFETMLSNVLITHRVLWWHTIPPITGQNRSTLFNKCQHQKNVAECCCIFLILSLKLSFERLLQWLLGIHCKMWYLFFVALSRLYDVCLVSTYVCFCCCQYPFASWRKLATYFRRPYRQIDSPGKEKEN